MVIPALLLLLGTAQGSAAPSAPEGWRRTEPKPGISLYTPATLKTGEAYTVALYPSASLGGKEPKAWLADFLARDPLPVGRIAAPQTTSTPIGSVTMTMVSGVSGGNAVLYIAASSGGLARTVRVAMSAPELYERYRAGTDALTAAIVSVAGETKASAQTPEATLGGPVRPGIYEGDQTWGGEPHARLRVTLYANGEYRLEHPNRRGLDRDGRYTYDAATGALSISRLDYLVHNAGDPRDASCVLTIVGGEPAIVADNDRGISRAKATLRWTGEAKRPSPETERKAERANAAEARRYKFTVVPGKGLKTGAVQAILHRSKFLYNPMGSRMTNWVTVLLKDGTAHEGLPAPLEAWDVAASRRGEPKTWGKWKKGPKGYLVAWNGGAYTELAGSVVAPAPAGGRLEGYYWAGTGGGGLMFSSFSKWGVRLGLDGRFLKSASSGSGSTSTYTDATGVLIATGGGASSAGTYRLEGYTAVLKHDDGRVQRMPFFRLGGDMIWFEDSILLRDKE